MHFDSKAVQPNTVSSKSDSADALGNALDERVTIPIKRLCHPILVAALSLQTNPRASVACVHVHNGH